MIANATENKRGKIFKKINEEKFTKGQIVLMSKNENLGEKNKEDKGRFKRNVEIMEVGENGTYIVKDENGKIFRKSHWNLKSSEKNSKYFSGGDVRC